MLVNFRFSNYKSFKDVQTFTMVASKSDDKSQHVISTQQANLLKISSVYGGNASGKSNFVDAMAYTQDIIKSGKLKLSDAERYFKLGVESAKQNSNFEYEILIGEQVFAYGLSVNFADKKIEAEYLYEVSNQQNKSYFDMDYINQVYEFADDIIQDTTDLNRWKVYFEDFKKKPVSLFLPFFAKIDFEVNDDKIQTIKNVYNWFDNVLVVIKPQSRFKNILGLFSEEKNTAVVSVIDLLKSFDTGITNVNFEKYPLEKLELNLKNKLPNVLIEKISDDIEKFRESNESKPAKEIKPLAIVVNNFMFRVLVNKNEILIEEIRFEHGNRKNILFSLDEESDGTKRLIELIYLLYSVQFKKSNKIFVIDELNRSFHPMLTLDFIQKFLQLSQSNSQIIITSYETILLSENIFRQDELWVVDRNASGASTISALSKFEIDNKQFISENYLVGRYGGIPKFRKILVNKESL